MTETDQQLPTLGRLARRTVGTLIGAFENRAELFALEFEEENDRILRLVFFGVTALFLLMMVVVLVTGMVIFLVPEPYRIYAASAFAVVYLAGAAAAAWTVKKLVKQAPFAESLKQIKKDAEFLDAFK